MNRKLIKTIGIMATIVGFGINLVSEWVKDQNTNAEIDVKIDEKLSKALADKATEIES